MNGSKKDTVKEYLMALASLLLLFIGSFLLIAWIIRVYDRGLDGTVGYFILIFPAVSLTLGFLLLKGF